MEFKWLNESSVQKTDDRIEIIAPAQTVFWGGKAQAPVGNGGSRIYENLSIEKKTVKNIRAGK